MVSTGRSSDPRFNDPRFTAGPGVESPSGAGSKASGASGGAHQRAPGMSEHEPYEQLLNAASDWAGFAQHYFSAQSDLVKMSMRRMLVLGIAWLFGRIALYVAIGYAMYLVLHGISGGIAELLGNRPWAGNLITGGVFLAVVALAVHLGTKKFVKLNRRQIESHYAHRRKVQQTAADHMASHAAATAQDAAAKTATAPSAAPPPFARPGDSAHV